MVKILSKLESNGIKVDDTYLKRLSKKFEERLVKIEKEIYQISKKKFNIGSPKQLGEIIYNELKINSSADGQLDIDANTEIEKLEEQSNLLQTESAIMMG